MKISVKTLTRTAVLLALAVSIQYFLKIQWLVGPSINTILVLATGYVGAVSGTTIGLLTPLIAFGLGIMPLAVVVPFIMGANALLCLGFAIVKKYNSFLGLFTGALLKFGFLVLAVNFIIQVPPKVTAALGIPQLFTAITGGIVALIILRYLPTSVEQ